MRSVPHPVILRAWDGASSNATCKGNIPSFLFVFFNGLWLSGCQLVNDDSKWMCIRLAYPLTAVEKYAKECRCPTSGQKEGREYSLPHDSFHSQFSSAVSNKINGREE